MIKFFRHIRKSLLMENKTGKYIKYAIGEIMLVVIGILIALQVNNWNEELKLKKEEHNTLEKLYLESGQIVEYFNAIYNAYENLILGIDKSANALNNKSLNRISEVEFAFGVYSTAYFEAISPPKSTYQELNSTGKINNIRSDSVRKSISDYYSTLEYMNTQLVYFRNQYTKPVDAGGEDFVFIYDNNSDERIKAKINFDKLANNKIFVSKHTKALRDQIVFQEMRKTLLDYSKKMHLELKKEIDKTND